MLNYRLIDYSYLVIFTYLLYEIEKIIPVLYFDLFCSNLSVNIENLILIPYLLFWLTVFSNFHHLSKDFTLVSVRNMSAKVIDGSVLEGGGQILRLSVAFSCLLEQPILINNIRAGRSNPGLKPQHLAGIQLVKQMCNAITNGDHQNSCELTFQPKTLKLGNFNLNVNSQTAASIPLMIQSALPVAIFSNHNSSITMKGGTDVSFAPSMDYVKKVLFPIYKLFGVHCDALINQRGFYPKGRGEVELTVNPVTEYLKPIEIINFGSQSAIKGFVFISGPKHQNNKHTQIVQDLATAVKNKLNLSGYHKITIETEVGDSDGAGGSLVLVADTGTCLIGSSALYDMRRSTVKSITDEACDKLLLDLEVKSCIDPNALDNIIIFMALANGKSKVKCREITLHTKTAIFIAEQFTEAKFSIKKMDDGLNEIICEGIGMKTV